MAKLAAALPALTGVASAFGPIGTILGAVSSAQSLLGGNKPKTPAAPTPAQAPAFKPQKPTAVERPADLASFSGYDPIQERTAIATKGVNQGLGKDESNYYKNLLQRSLIGDDNQVTGDPNSLLPVESQYFSGQGFNTSDIMKFLEQMRG